MTDKMDFTARQLAPDGKSKWAVFLPAVSGACSFAIGRQTHDPTYIPPQRWPQGLKDISDLNWLDQNSLFPYKWSLYSAGHANLDLTVERATEHMIRARDKANTFLLADSGGFQIATGCWDGDWKAGSGCPKAEKKRRTVLEWLDNIADYSMILDIPTYVLTHPKGSKNTGIKTYADTIAATHYNNEYFLDNRKGIHNGGAKFLNVLQGGVHTQSEEWYHIMKKYSDPGIYPHTHFNGWAFGGQNKCDMHLALLRLVDLWYDGLLQEGTHDWIHFLGIAKIDWALMITALQTVLRKYVNPSITLSFDAASPFLSAANGQVYSELLFPDRKKWGIRAKQIVDDKKYSSDTRMFRDAILQDGLINAFEDSVITERLMMKDICYYQPGMVNRLGKEGKTSWDSFTYCMLMAHNVAKHIEAVQIANELYEQGQFPYSMHHYNGLQQKLADVLEEIFSAPTKEKSIEVIHMYDRFWSSQNGAGKTKNSHTKFGELFTYDEPSVSEDEVDEIDEEDTEALDKLEHDIEEESND